MDLAGARRRGRRSTRQEKRTSFTLRGLSSPFVFTFSSVFSVRGLRAQIRGGGMIETGPGVLPGVIPGLAVLTPMPTKVGRQMRQLFGCLPAVVCLGMIL